jgi:MFS family permease
VSAVPSQIPVRVPARPGAVRRNLLFDLSSAIGVGATMAIVGTLLPASARQQGLDALGLAVLAALPFTANLLTLFAGRIGPRTPTQLALLRSAGAASLVLVFVAPHPIVIGIVTFAFWTSFVLGAPLHQRLWSDMYPATERGRLIGLVGSGRFAAGTLALLAATLLLDGSSHGAILVLVAAIGAVSALATSRLKLDSSEPIAGFAVRDSLRTIAGHRVLRRLTIAQLVFGAGLVASPPLIAMVYIDRLGLGLDQVALAGLALFGTRTIAVALWGRATLRIGGLRTAAMGSLVAVVSMLLFALAPDLAVVILASALLGAGAAAIDVAWPVVIADHAEPDAQAQAAAGLMAIMGARGLVVPFLVLVPIGLGWLDVAGGLVLCGLVTLAGAVLYMWAADLLESPRQAGIRARALVVTAFRL